MELVLRFLDRKQGAVNREYWGECSSATLPQSVDLRGDKKENKLITSYDCQAITVSFKRKMYKKAWCMCKVVVWLPLGTLRSNDPTARRTSLKKWICVPSVFIVIIPTHLLCQMYANPPEAEFQVTISKLRKRNKISPSLVYVLHETQN